MDEYIEREALYEKLHEAGGCDAPKESWADGYDKGITEAIKILNEAPAADVVEVVRCGKCKQMFEKGWCALHNTPMGRYDFCSYGERKDSAKNG